MKTKFKTFHPYIEDGRVYTAVNVLNEWLEDNPSVEIVHWQCIKMTERNDIQIVIQYREIEQ